MKETETCSISLHFKRSSLAKIVPVYTILPEAEKSMNVIRLYFGTFVQVCLDNEASGQ